MAKESVGENMQKRIIGVRKAAILLIALGPEISSQILKLLPDNLIQKVTYEIANIDYVEPEEKNRLLKSLLKWHLLGNMF